MDTTDPQRAPSTKLIPAFTAADQRKADDVCPTAHRTGPDALRELVRLLARQAATETWQAHFSASSNNQES
jgi:hypothetical protein